jgi:DNA-binding NarL/FixJ family response regulator
MPFPIKALLVDDDPWFAQAFRLRFEASFSDITLETRAVPDVSGTFDIYMIDNDFDGELLAGKLAAQIRAARADARVFAVSCQLDAATLKTLINQGCHGAFAKGDVAELIHLFSAIRAYQKSRAAAVPGPANAKGLSGVVRSIADLLREWNSMLDRQEKGQPAR